MGKMGKMCVFLLALSFNGILGQSLLFASARRLTDFAFRVAGTTVGVVRGGISVINATVSNLMSGALSMTDRVRHSLEEFRKYMLTGIPEIGLPILDPLHIGRIDLNISNESLTLKGYVEDVTVRYLSKFRLDYVNYRVPQHILYLNITFPLLDIRGFYDIKGEVGELFSFFGKGNFRVRLYNFSLGTISRIRIGEGNYPPLYIQVLRVTPKLKKLENNFEGLMNNEELGATFNKAITRLAPTALDTLWPDIEQEVTKMITSIINRKIQDLSVGNMLGRVADMFKINLNQGRLHVHN